MDVLEREPELAALDAALVEAGSGRGGVVLVEGEPGIGKTSLVGQFAEQVGERARVLMGTCDDLSIPRPFAPLADLTGTVSRAVAEELTGASRPEELRRLVLRELSEVPTVLVLEDLHWADAATLDLVQVIGRRISALPALLVLTYRRSDLAPDHPLWRTLEALAGVSRHLTLAPLSRQAVGQLVGEERADRVYFLTEGNPFFVHELAHHDQDVLPPSVANAVLGRVSRLSEGSRELVDLAAMVPAQVPMALLERLLPQWARAAEEPERRLLLSVDDRAVRFRHQLVRVSIQSSIPLARRRLLHTRILRALIDSGADAAQIAHHAEEAGDREAIARYAPVAGRRAAALGAHREAYAHLHRAVEVSDQWKPSDRAGLHEDLAASAYAVDRIEEACSELEQALSAYRELGDQRAVARCLRRRSRFHWYGVEGARARADALAAVQVAESVGDEAELARAVASLAQLAMLAGDLTQARKWGERAVSLAESSASEDTRVHAMVTLGVCKATDDPDTWDELVAAHEAADRAGERHEAARALVALADLALAWVRPEDARDANQRCLSYCNEHQVDTLLAFETVLAGWLRARQGHWDAAVRLAGPETGRGSSVTRLLAELVLAEVAVRRGDPDAADRLDRVRELADRSGEIQWIGPVVELEVERALLTGTAMPHDRLLHTPEVSGSAWPVDRWAGPRLTGWAAVAGVDLPPVPSHPDPHAAMVRRDWVAAAAAYDEAGWSYDRALMLSLVETEAALTEALRIARSLGAEPLVGRVQQRMRELGLPVRRGPQRAARANAAGLTAREQEVLHLLAEGLTNAEIADRLTLSVRTAERHVSAVLRKLGAEGRRQAVRRAVELGLG